MKLKRFSRKKLKKYYAKQMLLPHVVPPSEPHTIPRCVACDDAKNLEFRRDGDGNMYYRCHNCGFESESIGPAPYYLK